MDCKRLSGPTNVVADFMSGASQLRSTMAPQHQLVAQWHHKSTRTLLEPVLIRSIGQEPRKRVLWCPESRSRSKPSPFDRSVLDFLTAAFLWPQQLWRPSTEEKLTELPPLHPAAQLIQDEILTLHPFTNLTPESLLRLAIGVEMPFWLMATKEACHIASAE